MTTLFLAMAIGIVALAETRRAARAIRAAAPVPVRHPVRRRLREARRWWAALAIRRTRRLSRMRGTPCRAAPGFTLGRSAAPGGRAILCFQDEFPS